ncbi:MAG: M20 family peptidase [Candidatus Lokiarchaeota archaeon]|nr:M20 family peptidase [Candidatus Lokiarchaeota archaeon]
MVNLDEIYLEVDNLARDHIMNLMKSLIAIDTTVPPGNSYREYVDILTTYFKKLGFSLEEVIVPEDLVKQTPEPLVGPRINLIATKNYNQDKDITFYGHMDVVPAPNDGKEKWRFPPFEATMIKSGKIYGRGTSDMKGAMVCLILALQIMEKLHLTPKYNITIVNCTDEEIGVWPGVRYLAEKGYIKGTVFCMEGVTIPVIPIGTAGAINVVVESIGRSCHSGMNFMGINALEETIPILNELMKLKKIVEKRESKNIPGLPRLGTGEKRNMYPMFNLDIIHSGTKANIVPGLCTLTINRRYIPDENIDDVIKEIMEAIEKGKIKSSLLNVKVAFNLGYPPMVTNPNAPDITRLKKVMMEVQKISEDEIRIIGASGSTDMGFVSEILKTDDIIFHGLGNTGSNEHGVNENIRLKEVLIYIKELIIFLCADL